MPNPNIGSSCKVKLIAFKIPSGSVKLDMYACVIPRKDQGLTPGDYVCEKHFSDSHIHVDVKASLVAKALTNRNGLYCN